MKLQKLLAQAEQAQRRIQQQLSQTTVEASAGGGMGSVRMNGLKQLLAVTIDREVLDPEDPEMLQDLIVAAVNEAARKVDEEAQKSLGALAGGLGLPGNLGNLF